MNTWGRFTSRIALVVALALLGGCGRFGSSDSNGSSTTTTAGEIGAGLSVRTSPTATTAPPAAKPTTPKSTCPNTDPSSEVRYDDSHITVAFTVSKLCPTHANDITMTMKVTNIGAAAVHYDANQVQFFNIKQPRNEQKHSWSDTDCVKPSGSGNKPAATLAPGTSVTFVGTYPAPAGVGNRELCRKLDTGNYDASGVFLLCEGAAYVDGYCDLSKDIQLFAQPVRITLDV